MPAAFDFEAHIQEMTNFAKIWEHMASPTFRRTMLEEVGRVAVMLVEEEFATGRNPYGKRWVPHRDALYWKARKSLTKVQTKRFRVRAPRTIHVSQILSKTGAMANTIRYKITDESVTVYSPLRYTIFHQRGTRHMPQRLIFPEDLIGLPERWRRAFDGAAVLVFQRLLRNWAFR